MGFVVLGLFSLSNIGLVSSFIIMLSHGFTSSILFILVTLLYNRYHTRIIRSYKGLICIIPVYSFFLFFTLLFNISFPFTLNFWGEIYIFKSLLNIYNLFFLILIIFSIIFSAIYSFLIYNKICLGIISKNIYLIRDLKKQEIISISFFLFFLILLGLYPIKLIDNLSLNINYLLI